MAYVYNDVYVYTIRLGGGMGGFGSSVIAVQTDRIRLRGDQSRRTKSIGGGVKYSHHPGRSLFPSGVLLCPRFRMNA